MKRTMKRRALAVSLSALFHGMLLTALQAETLGEDVNKNPMALIVYLKTQKKFSQGISIA
ncbi:hypothetical protein RFM68_20775 [Mesorhizobium sp. MSK_1335]|uniref:Uncharacterized protein n=1 Tax=Mesorhizobium montanum TaxID=3072323 RepID=A0ABU4ZNN6_9HYPH|nr:hypothetical protein [Mesorhizobium sp. MSK_1335]MDX8526940.1 hypothetical protein [Mesorhizobium sp. MSK_1335]